MSWLSFIPGLASKESVRPVLGSVVYCSLVGRLAEHSGIHVGNDRIAHLNRKGEIEIVSRHEFLRGTTGFRIYVSCKDGRPVGSRGAAEVARSMAERKSVREYNVILNNCHQFVAGCLHGRFDNSTNFLMMLKLEAGKLIQANSWHAWEYKS